MYSNRPKPTTIMWFLVFVVVAVTLLYVLGTKSHGFWAKRGVHHVKGLPFVGSIWPVVSGKVSFAQILQDWCQTYSDQRYFEIYKFQVPTLVIRDPQLIKQIMVKDFDTFPTRTQMVAEEVDPLWAKNLAALSNMDEWHDMRCTLSPSFTASKMKTMFGLIKDCARQFSHHYLRSGDTVALELKEAFSRYTNDTTATTAFGVTCNSFENPGNEFYAMGRDAANFEGIRCFRFFLYVISPALTRLLKIGMFSKELRDFFGDIVHENLRAREQQGIVRPDMLHLLTEARKGRLKYEEGNERDLGFAAAEESDRGRSQKRRKVQITDEDIVAHALLFFVAGFETSSTALVFTVYELVFDPEIQRRLREEVDVTMKECNGDLTYDALMKMKYLDMVISETLRKWPPSLFTDRLSVKPYTIDSEFPGEKPLHLPAGSNCWIPIYAIHRDPKNYSEPERFDPERFSDENKRKINPFAYIPFGCGPRNCIGSRFALLGMKAILTELISKFEFVAVERTKIPMVISNSLVLPLLEARFWVGLKPRAL